MPSLAERAAQWDIETEYVDVAGRRQVVPEQALEAILNALADTDIPAQDRVLPAAVVVRLGRPQSLPLKRLPPYAAVRWTVLDGDKPIAAGHAPARDCRLPKNLPVGRFTLRISIRGLSGVAEHTAPLLVTPDRVWQGDDPESRMWVLAVQLYGVRSRRNWGHGDFTDLADLLDLAAEIGAAGIGVNPLHVLFVDRPEQASPYAPNSRLFLNPLYIDLDAVPEFPGVAAAGLELAIAQLRDHKLVDYTGVAEAKLMGLQLAFERFRSAPDPQRRQAFEQFRRRRGTALARFACFEVLRRRFPQVWWEWPEEWRKPTEQAIAALRESDAAAVELHEFGQWLADSQLAACQQRARDRGLPLGLYLDVAVGVDAGGADAWSEQAAVMGRLSAGAPPDLFNPNGQNWGIAGFHPRGLMAEGFKPFRDTIAAAMRHAGAIRIDHVLGLNRLFLIPHGASAREGAYFRFPLEALLAVVAQESNERRCLVVGEDLGTVPQELRDALADWGVWSYRVTMFERGGDGAFVPPDRYPRDSVATFSTHDLPTYAGWTSGHDLAIRREIGQPSGENEEQRQQAIAALREALARAGFGGEAGFAAVARYLAATPSRLVVISIEDVLGVVDQPNLPGTIDEHPNWRQHLPLPLEDWGADRRLRHLAQLLAEAGRSGGPGAAA